MYIVNISEKLLIGLQTVQTPTRLHPFGVGGSLIGSTMFAFCKMAAPTHDNPKNHTGIQMTGVARRGSQWQTPVAETQISPRARAGEPGSPYHFN